ncbi:uncharacterized protein LOC113865202 isoform X2 [Abrus precatorius]|uniref:Uncharacterized protein LOC113865202 isoform X2 n=1 Tax=Abrus precatorius TaxID=3816 RepID=A0A8B8LJ83_ABRPR|nr:uncharacterized protein LOC113865202 isoform X2 [Abrus precatorius]
MGGGGAMRTAAKLAGLGVGRSGLRGSSASLPTEQSVRQASRPASVTGVSLQGSKAAEVAPLHTVSWEDWEFEDDGDLVVPRMVFGSAPSFEEAKEATTELKDAIDKIYLSSDSSKCEGSSPDSQVSVLSPTRYEPVTKSCVIEAISNPSVPKHAIQAFQLLSTSPEAQTVVASIASDPNVWKAVMENSAINNFFQSHQTVGSTEKVVELTAGAEVAGFEGVQNAEKVEPETSSGKGFFDFMGLLQNIKLTVAELVSSMSSFLQNIFPAAEKEKKCADTDESSNFSFMDSKTFMGGTFMGLVVLVIMVVLVKRV